MIFGAIGALLVSVVVAVIVLVVRRRRRKQEETPLLTSLLKNLERPTRPEEPRHTYPGDGSFQPEPIQSNHTRPAVPASEPKPDEGTLQLLPGRLEVVSGSDRMKEIRFVKAAGPAVVTFGRYAGATHTHVQVDSPTVSRMHASMRFTTGLWHIKNLSDTNPVVVNGHALPAQGEELVLKDGDLVEMGDVILRFRPR